VGEEEVPIYWLKEGYCKKIGPTIGELHGRCGGISVRSADLLFWRGADELPLNAWKNRSGGLASIGRARYGVSVVKIRVFLKVF
jgi:hypothetical protein